MLIHILGRYNRENLMSNVQPFDGNTLKLLEDDLHNPTISYHILTELVGYISYLLLRNEGLHKNDIFRLLTVSGQVSRLSISIYNYYLE